MMLDLSVIIPFKDKSRMTIDCLNSLQTFGCPIKEIFLISNNSSSAELDLVEQAVAKYDNTSVLTYDKPFNFQAINNWAATKATGKVLLLLNNDIELVSQSAKLLESMYATALETQSGAVGCTLLYEDGKTIQHAGVHLIPGGTADHLYIGKKLREVKDKIANNTYLYDITKTMQVTAVTAAAVMVEKTKFDSIHGLDEEFIICGGDVDLCLRLMDKGYKNYIVGLDNGYMIHKESKSRSMLAVPYVDFVKSYTSYIKYYDNKTGDKYLHWEEVKNV